MSERILVRDAGKIGVSQSKLKSDLRVNCRLYLRYRHLKEHGFQCKTKITLKSIQNQQADINNMRKALGLPPIKFLQELKAQIKNL